MKIYNVNKLLLFQFAKLLSMPSDLECVFVLGAPRSGTTLLQTRIAAHSKFWSIEKETGFFRPDLYTRLEAISSKPPSLGSLTNQFEKFVKSFEICGIFVEKTPQHVKNLSWILRKFPRARVVHIMRDPRDVFVSAQSNTGVKYRDNPAKFSKYYNACLRGRIRAGYENSRVKDITYEDLVEAPREIMESVMRFLGDSFQERQFDSINDRRGAQLRFKKLNNPVESSSVGQWVKRLSAEEADKIWSISGGTFLNAKSTLIQR